MRTTLNIDDDILAVAKELASSRKTTAGRVISELARRGLRNKPDDRQRPTIRNGFELLPSGGKTVTVNLVDELLEDDV